MDNIGGSNFHSAYNVLVERLSNSSGWVSSV
ncbi:hypothetical protein HNR33_000321 [Brassicibacter mesophilus]